VSDDSSDNESFETTPSADRRSFDVGDRVNSNKSLKFMHWNVNGLMSKIFDHEFVSFISSFHFVCLVETFTLSLN
jgi:hypothetical protein